MIKLTLLLTVVWNLHALKINQNRATWAEDAEDSQDGDIISRVAGKTLVGKKRLRSIIKYISGPTIPEGDIVECGVWMGGTSMAMAYAELGAKSKAGLSLNRNLWLFDTFEGMSEPDSEKDDPMAIDRWKNAGNPDAHRKNQKGRDASGNSISSHEYVDMNGTIRWNYGPLEQVKKNMEITGYPKERIYYVKGKVEDTLVPGASDLPEKIAVLRLDTDWYLSTKAELDILFPRLVPGGLLQIDDYCHWDGSRKATDEWLLQNKDQLEPFEIGKSGDACFTMTRKK